MNLLFKAFSALLSYPNVDMREALPEITNVIRTSPLVARREREAIFELIDEIGQGDILDVEERYVDLFDRGRSLSLHLFEHLHGESRDRGSAMVDLTQLYAGAGFELTSRELPDYLPVVLEYLSCRDMAEAREMLGDCAHILQAITKALLARQSRYAAVLQSLLIIAGENPVDATVIKPVKERLEMLDKDWAEQPAFANTGGVPGAHGRQPPNT